MDSIFTSLPVEVTVALIGLVGMFITPTIKFIFNKLNKVRTFDEEAQMAYVLNNELSLIKHEFGALRVFVNQYHNGGHYYTGNSIQKVSMSYESYNENKTHSILPKFQSIPISFLSSLVYLLSTHGKVVQTSLDSITDTTFRRILKEENVHGHIAYAVHQTKWMFRWHPLFLVRKKVMVASIHIYFEDDINLSDLDLVALENKARKLEQYIV